VIGAVSNRNSSVGGSIGSIPRKSYIPTTKEIAQMNDSALSLAETRKDRHTPQSSQIVMEPLPQIDNETKKDDSSEIEDSVSDEINKRDKKKKDTVTDDLDVDKIELITIGIDTGQSQGGDGKQKYDKLAMATPSSVNDTENEETIIGRYQNAFKNNHRKSKHIPVVSDSEQLMPYDEDESNDNKDNKRLGVVSENDKDDNHTDQNNKIVE